MYWSNWYIKAEHYIKTTFMAIIQTQPMLFFAITDNYLLKSYCLMQIISLSKWYDKVNFVILE